MAIDTSVILAEKAIVRLALEGKARYGLWHRGKIRLYEGSPFAGGKPGKTVAPLKKARLLAPCRPSKVVAVGLNYRAHAREMKMVLPEEPLIFLKPPSAIIAPGEAIVRPLNCQRVDYEAELAVVISRVCRQVSAEEAGSYILGYTCLNDVTERVLQAKDQSFDRSKGFDTFCPLGPAIALDVDPRSLAVKSLVNGKLRQNGHTTDLIFTVNELVSYISKIMTLRPGDAIATGTPAGVGPLLASDEVCIEVEGVGRLINPVKDAA